MNEVVIINNNGKLALLTPTPEALQTYSLMQIALKDVPAGLPFWIVPADSIPTDHTFFNAWEVDEEALGAPHGYGS